MNDKEYVYIKAITGQLWKFDIHRNKWYNIYIVNERK